MICEACEKETTEENTFLCNGCRNALNELIQPDNLTDEQLDKMAEYYQEKKEVTNSDRVQVYERNDKDWHVAQVKYGPNGSHSKDWKTKELVYSKSNVRPVSEQKEEALKLKKLGVF